MNHYFVFKTISPRFFIEEDHTHFQNIQKKKKTMWFLQLIGNKITDSSNTKIVLCEGYETFLLTNI